MVRVVVVDGAGLDNAAIPRSASNPNTTVTINAAQKNPSPTKNPVANGPLDNNGGVVFCSPYALERIRR